MAKSAVAEKGSDKASKGAMLPDDLSGIPMPELMGYAERIKEEKVRLETHMSVLLEDADRLRKAIANRMSDILGGDFPMGGKGSKGSGTRGPRRSTEEKIEAIYAAAVKATEASGNKTFVVSEIEKFISPPISNLSAEATKAAEVENSGVVDTGEKQGLAKIYKITKRKNA